MLLVISLVAMTTSQTFTVAISNAWGENGVLDERCWCRPILAISGGQQILSRLTGAVSTRYLWTGLQCFPVMKVLIAIIIIVIQSSAMSSKRLWTFLPDYLLFWAKGNHIKTIDHSWVGFRWELLVIFLSSVNQHFLKDRLWSGKEGGALACVCVEGNC